MTQIIFNDHVNAAMCAAFIAVLAAMFYFVLVAIGRARRARGPTAREAGAAGGGGFHGEPVDAMTISRCC